MTNRLFQEFRKRELSWVLCAATLLAPPAYAQDAAAPETTAEAAPATVPTAKKPKEKSERMTVTGSRLKRIDVENAVPTKVLTQDDFQKAGITSVTELLSAQTENTFGSFSGGGGYVSVGQATIDLHGLGSGRTLVLVNGRRLPSEASLGGTNINNIPLAMVDRVEILKMSASAVYGADAVAGVINVILKKSVIGSEFATKANISQEKGGNSIKASAVTGFNLFDTEITLAVGGGKTEEILRRNRKKLWAEAAPYDQGAGGAPVGTYSWGLLNPANPTSNLGNYTYKPSANCPAGNQVSLPNDPTNTLCRGDIRAASTGLLNPEKDEKFVTLNFEKTIGAVETSTTVLASTVDTSSNQINRTLGTNPARSGPYAIRFGDAPSEIKTQAAGLGLTYTDDQLIKINGPRLFPEIKGNTKTTDTSLGLLTSLNGELATDWGWTVEASHFTSKRARTFRKAPDRFAFIQNLFPVAVTEAPQINIFTDDLSGLNGYFVDLHSEEVNTVTGATAYVDGPLFTLTGGPARIAAGLSVVTEKYILRADSKDADFLNQFPETSTINKARYLGSFAADGEGDRTVTSAFTEFDMPFTKNLDLAVTGRFDNYSDFGSTFNYGTSLVGIPMPGLKLRANVGSGFKAPSLAEIYNRSSGGYLTVTDLEYCDNTIPADNPCGSNGKTYSVFVNSPGNEDLHEETSLSYNLGAVVEPFDFLNVSADYWAAEIKDVIGQEEIDKLVEKDIAGESTGASEIVRGDDNRISRIENSYSNLGRLRTQGFDVTSNLNFRAEDLLYGLSTSYSRVISRKVRPTLTDPEQEEVGSYQTPRYRLGNSLFAKQGNHNVSFDVNTVGRQESSRFEQDPTFGYISPESRYDINYGWAYSPQGSLSLGVYNIENRLASLHVIDKETREVSFDRERADVRGRQFQVGIRQAF